MNFESMDFDEIREHTETRKIVEDYGWDSLLESLQSNYPDRDLYQVSMKWFDNKEYSMKTKGGYGDLIVGWE